MVAAAVKRKKQKPTPEAAKDTPTVAQSKPKANGLWVNWEFLRNLSKRPPQTLFHGSAPIKEDYYLKLADTVLGPVERRKTDRTETAFREQSNKRKAG